MALQDQTIDKSKRKTQDPYPQHKPLGALSTRSWQADGDTREHEALVCLSSLFGLEEALIHPEHYHLPIFMTATSGSNLDTLLDAWVLSGLFYDYNLVVLAPREARQERRETVLRHRCLNRYPQALSHLAIYSGQIHDLQHGVSHYLKTSIPPFYFCGDLQDAFSKQAAKEGFVIIALNPLPWIEHNQNGFVLAENSPKSLALSLINILESPAYDGEVLRDIADRNRQQKTASHRQFIDI